MKNKQCTISIFKNIKFKSNNKRSITFDRIEIGIYHRDYNEYDDDNDYNIKLETLDKIIFEILSTNPIDIELQYLANNILNKINNEDLINNSNYTYIYMESGSKGYKVEYAP